MVDLIQVIEQIGREKGIEREVLIDAVGAAILSASRKSLGTLSDLRVDFDQPSRRFVLYIVKQVVEEVTNPRTEVALEEARRHQPDVQLGDESRIELETNLGSGLGASTVSGQAGGGHSSALPRGE